VTPLQVVSLYANTVKATTSNPIRRISTCVIHRGRLMKGRWSNRTTRAAAYGILL